MARNLLRRTRYDCYTCFCIILLNSEQRARFSQREAELRELIITGLTHLVSANTESGFKQCLSLAYDPDNRKRTIFAHVFSRVIGQGTVFHPEDKSVTKARHSALAELVKAPDVRNFPLSRARYLINVFWIVTACVGDDDLRDLSAIGGGDNDLGFVEHLRHASDIDAAHQSHDRARGSTNRCVHLVSTL